VGWNGENQSLIPMEMNATGLDANRSEGGRAGTKMCSCRCRTLSVILLVAEGDCLCGALIR
jgi:hypothetical protein